MNIEQNTKRLLDFVSEKFRAGELDNESMVQLIELCGNYLNLATIPDHAKRDKVSYNAVKKSGKVRRLFNVKFVVDND